MTTTRWPLIETALLLLILPIALFPGLNLWLAAAGGLILAGWLVRYARERRFWPATPLNLSLLLLLFMIGVSLWATYDVPFSLGKVAGLAYGIALFLALVDLLRRSFSFWYAGAAALILSSLGVIALGIVGTPWSTKFPVLGGIAALFNRLRALLPPLPLDDFNPNQIAGVLLWIAPFALAVAWGIWRPAAPRLPRWGALLRWGAVLLAITIYLIILLTQSRSGWLGLAVALPLMLYLLAGRRLRRGLAVAAVLGGLLLAGLAAADPAGFAAGAQNALGLRADALLDESGTGLGTLNGRLEIWSRAIYGLEDFPFTGMGMNTFRRVVHVLYPLFTVSPDVDVAHAHNHLLQTGLDLGLPGLVAYLALWAGCAAMLWRAWGRTADPWLRTLVAGLAGSLIAYWIYGLTDAVALGAKPGFIFWLLLALITSLHELVLGESRR